MTFAQGNAGPVTEPLIATDGSQAMMGGIADQNSEMVILVDNSTAMQAQDPDSSLATALAGFISRVDDRAEISVMAFAGDVSVVRSLAGDGADDSGGLSEAWSDIDYADPSRDIIRALERAVYELDYNGRAGIPKSIVIITASADDVVAVTDKDIDPAAVPRGLLDGSIELFAIRVGPGNTPLMMANLPTASITDEFAIDDIKGLQDILMELIERLPGEDMAPDVVAVGSPVADTAPAAPVVMGQVSPATNNPPVVPATALVEEDRNRSFLLIITAVILLFTLGSLVVLLFLRSRKSGSQPDVAVNEAYLRDIHGYTATEDFRLGEKATMLGRVAGKDSANIDYIVIPEPTIGRRHAVIECKDFGCWITDQGSINGTFVNDIPISSEIRLKHGDIIRLHKYEFQFVVPELDEAAATRVSNTVMASHKPGGETGSEGLELDSAFSGDDAVPPEASPGLGRDDETLLPGHDMEPAIEDEYSGSEETLMPDNNHSVSKPVENPGPPPVKKESVEDPGQGGDDETLMPDLFDEPGDDATIRPNPESTDDEIFDITGGDEEKP